MDKTEWAGVPVDAYKLPPALRSRYHDYAFTSFDDRGAFAYNTIREWSIITDTILNTALPLVRRLTDSSLAIAEWDTFSKMTANWRDKGYGTLVQEKPLIVKNEEQAEWLRPALRRKGATYAGAIRGMGKEALRQIYDAAPIPTRRGKGAPYWFTGTMPRAAASLGRIAREAKSVAELDRLLIEAGGASIAPCITLDIRYQSSAKARADYAVIGGRLERVGERVRPKARKIQALPFSYNYLSVGAASVIKGAMRQVSHRHDGTTDEAERIGKSGLAYFATDLSNYDDTIAYETDKAWRDEVLGPTLRALFDQGIINRTRMNMIMEVHERIASIDSLGPPAVVGEGARLVPTWGANKSGQRFTSQEATDINDARIETKAKDLRLHAAWTNFGDDTLVGTKEEDGETRWNDPEFDNHGFVEKAAPDPAFLMRRVNGGYGYVSRMLMACVNREVRHEPPNVYAAASAIAVRKGLIRGNPLAGAFDECLESIKGPLKDAYRLSETAPLADLMMAAINQMDSTKLDARDDLAQAIASARDTGQLTPREAKELQDYANLIGIRSAMRYGEMERFLSAMPLKVATSYVAEHAYRRRT